eukprot:scaffold1347_cov350-Pavlova_lutheri.AAC.8
MVESREVTQVETCNANEEILVQGFHRDDANDGLFGGAFLSLDRRMSLEGNLGRSKWRLICTLGGPQHLRQW